MRNEKELVSCVTPVWNGEKYIGEMLDSVLRQTYPFVEMILVDDGSTDHTLEIAEHYRAGFKEKGYRYHILQTGHKSASAAINQGLRLVSGEYLIWPDSDDILEPESIEKRVRYLAGHPECDCVRSTMYYFDSNGRIEKAGEKIGDIKKEKLFFDILEARTYVCCGCYMLKTENFFSIYPNRCIPEYPVGQNFQMLLPYMYHYKCNTIPEELYGVRVHQDSHSRRALTQEEEEQRFRQFESLIDDISRICKIQRIREKRRIACWKQERRRRIAGKYDEHSKKIRAEIALFFYGRSRAHALLLQSLRRVMKRNAGE